MSKCTKDIDCPQGTHCDSDFGCLPNLCTSEQQCGPDRTCFNYFCVEKSSLPPGPYCGVNTDCTQGNICEHGYCVTGAKKFIDPVNICSWIGGKYNSQTQKCELNEEITIDGLNPIHDVNDSAIKSEKSTSWGWVFGTALLATIAGIGIGYSLKK
jgi:hypothetical protein